MTFPISCLFLLVPTYVWTRNTATHTPGRLVTFLWPQNGFFLRLKWENRDKKGKCTHTHTSKVKILMISILMGNYDYLPSYMPNDDADFLYPNLLQQALFPHGKIYSFHIATFHFSLPMNSLTLANDFKRQKN